MGGRGHAVLYSPDSDPRIVRQKSCSEMLLGWEASLIPFEVTGRSARFTAGRPYLLLRSCSLPSVVRSRQRRMTRVGQLPFAFPGEGIKPMRYKEDSSK